LGFLQHWSFCSGLLWLFEIFWTLNCFFYLGEECHWNFDRGYIGHIDWFW
jgi:hypothetical protein